MPYQEQADAFAKACSQPSPSHACTAERTVIALYCCDASGPSSALYRLALPSMSAPAGMSLGSTGLECGEGGPTGEMGTGEGAADSREAIQHNKCTHRIQCSQVQWASEAAQYMFRESAGEM